MNTDLVTRDTFICPISRQIFNKPVLAADGFYYEQSQITLWFKTNNTSPLTNLPIDKKLIECHLFNNYYNDDTYKHYPYTNGVQYVMKEDGLYTLDGRRSDYNDDQWNSDSNNDQDRVNDNGTYRYNQNIDSLEKVQKESEDSLKAKHEDELKRMKDSLQKEKENIDQKLEKLDKKTASYQDKSEPLPVDNYSFIIYI